jgi:hypothetical protein
MLFFIGVCYSTFTVGFSSLMVYFLIQTVSSFSLFVFFSFSLPFLFMFSLFLKLSMFPFHSWFLAVVYRFSNFSFYISSTFHKVPPFLMVYSFTPFNSFSSLCLLSCVLTLAFSGSSMLSSSDFRVVLASSSVGNNVWFLLSTLSSVELLVSFMLVYSFLLFILFSFLKGGTNFSPSRESTTYFFSLVVLMVSGLPPSPLFLFKLSVVFFMAYSIPSSFLLLFLLRGSAVLVGYVRIVLGYILISFSSPSHYSF